MSHSRVSKSWIIKCKRVFTNENKFSSFNTFHDEKKHATFFQRDRILNSSRWICLVHVTRTSLLYLRDSHDQARVRLAIKVKVKSGNFQTPPLNHASVPDLRYIEIGEIVVSCLENMTFYDYHSYIDLSKKIEFFFPLSYFISFVNSVLFFFFLFSNETLFLAWKTFKLYRDIWKKIWTLSFIIHVYWYCTLYVCPLSWINTLCANKSESRSIENPYN